jgi:hypothetical protein
VASGRLSHFLALEVPQAKGCRAEDLARSSIEVPLAKAVVAQLVADGV